MKLNFRKANQQDLSFLLQLEKESFPPFQQSNKQTLLRSIKSPFQEVVILEDDNQNALAATVL